MHTCVTIFDSSIYYQVWSDLTWPFPMQRKWTFPELWPLIKKYIKNIPLRLDLSTNPLTIVPLKNQVFLDDNIQLILAILTNWQRSFSLGRGQSLITWWPKTRGHWVVGLLVKFNDHIHSVKAQEQTLPCKIKFDLPIRSVTWPSAMFNTC